MTKFGALLVTGALFVLLGCHSSVNTSQPSRDINSVLAAHSAEIMALPNVTGIYVGLAPDEKTQCIKVMLKEADRGTMRKIPKSLEGYPVHVEISGEIKPLK